MPDKTLTCKECGNTFVFTEREQEFYKEKNFKNEPQRCPECRAANKARIRGNREMYPAVCASCGRETTVPFQPTGDKPVYCKECYQARSKR